MRCEDRKEGEREGERRGIGRIEKGGEKAWGGVDTHSLLYSLCLHDIFKIFS